MYLHIGNEVTVTTDEIIAVINGKYEDAERKAIYSALPKGKKIISSVLTDNGVYYSAINSLTLQKRAFL